MNRFIHLIYIPFVGVGIRPYRGDEWYQYRVEIFKQYTLKSLLNQSNRGFILWLSFTPEMKDHPITLELEQYLRDQKVVTLMTFDGLMYHDDKFNGGFREKVMNFARIVRMAYQERNPQPVNTLGAFIKMLLTNRPPLKFGWRRVLKNFFEDKNGTLKHRLNQSLGHIKSILNTDAFDWVYVSRIDSDDMFREDFVQEVQSFPPFPGALTCKNGYVYNSNTGQLAEWNPKAHPPFHTIIFPKETFLDPDRYIQYFRGFKSHEDVPSVFNSQNLKDGKYCVLIHNKHISTVWDHPWRGKELEGDDKKEILERFLGGSTYWKMDGLKFALPDDKNQAAKEIISDYLAHKAQGRDYEPETTKVIKSLIKEGDVCVDVGASIGYMTMQMARASKNKVLAFEPTSNQCEYIQKNAELNGFDVQVHNLAAWDSAETEFVRMENIHMNAGNETPMKGVVLDDVLPEKVDFIKMDIDGSEPRALKGLIKTFERNPQLKMIIEYYPKCIEELGNKPQDMLDVLDKYFNYERIPGDYNDEYYNFVCTRK